MIFKTVTAVWGTGIMSEYRQIFQVDRLDFMCIVILLLDKTLEKDIETTLLNF